MNVLFELGGDLRVRRLGFGAMRITGPGIWGAPSDRAGALATLRRCLDLGINLIDTADSYGPHVSEGLIAEALYPYPAGLVIATKGGFRRPGPGQWTTDGRPEYLREALDGSLKRLRLERIDLYQLHRVDPAVPPEEQFRFLQQAQAAGKIRHIGLSEVGVEMIDRARKFFPVVSVQNRYNVAEREWQAVLDYCDREQIAFIPWHPIRAGAAAGSGLRQYARRWLGSQARIDRAVAHLAKRHGATSSQIMLAWLLHVSDVMLPIPGTSSVKHLEENMAAESIRLSPEEVASLK